MKVIDNNKTITEHLMEKNIHIEEMLMLFKGDGTTCCFQLQNQHLLLLKSFAILLRGPFEDKNAKNMCIWHF